MTRDRCPWALPFRPALRPRRREEGQVMILFALVIVVLLGTAALVVDLGLLRTDEARLQNAMDAGALAASQDLPAGASTIAAVSSTATSYAQANFAGLTGLQISYRCLIGVDASGNPRTSDMPGTCSVATGSTWTCTETACWAPCNPVSGTTGYVATDVCNTIQLTASATRQFGFGGAVGVRSGSTGATASVACNGLCGSPPSVPLDLVVLVDRTGSMGNFFPDGTAVAGLRAGARAVLGAYNPDIQRVAFGAIGPSTTVVDSAADSSNTPRCLGTPNVHAQALTITSPSVTYNGVASGTNYTRQVSRVAATSATTGSSTASTLTVTTPTGTASGDVLVMVVSVNALSSLPTQTGWTLINSTTNSSGSGTTVASYYQVLSSAPAANYQVKFNSGSGTNRYAAAAVLTAYRGVDTSSVLDATAGADATGTNRNLAAGAQTTSTDGAMVIGVYAHGTTTTITKPGSMSLVAGANASSGPILQVDDLPMATAGSSGTITATTSANVNWAAHAFSLRAAVRTLSTVSVSALPTNAAGDVLIAALTVTGGSNTTITAPAGWTLIRRTDKSTTLSVATYYKQLSAADTSTPAWDVNSASAALTIASYSDVDPTSIFDPAAGSGSIGTGNSSSSTGTSASATGITTGAAYTQLVAVFATTANTSWSTVTGFTERSQTTFGTAGPTLALDDDQQVTAGATGTKSSTAGASGTWVAQLFGLRARVVDSYSIDVNNATALAQWIPVGFSGLDTGTPAIGTSGSGGYAEAYSSGGAYVASSHLGQAIDCFDQSGTGTNLATPLDMAVKYLQTYGRSGARKGVILETDGAPGSCPSSLSTTICDKYTDASTRSAATALKSAGITLFTIGYGSADPVLLGDIASTKVGTSTCTAAENSDGDAFFCAPTASDLSSVFAAAAQALAAGPHLVQLYPRPAVTAISPSSGSKAGGITVTVTGTGFTEAYAVTVGGASAAFTVVSDTSIRLTLPASGSTGAADIQVSTPGGSSKIVSADRLTYTP